MDSSIPESTINPRGQSRALPRRGRIGADGEAGGSRDVVGRESGVALAEKMTAGPSRGQTRPAVLAQGPAIVVSSSRNALSQAGLGPEPESAPALR